VHERHGAVIALRDRAAIQPRTRRRFRAVLPDGRLHRPEKHTKQAADHLRLLPQVPPDPLRHRQHPLTVRHPRQHVVHHVGGRLDHPAGGAGRTDVAALAAERDQNIILNLLETKR
jgi:hypothetical protein